MTIDKKNLFNCKAYQINGLVNDKWNKLNDNFFSNLCDYDIDNLFLLSSILQVLEPVSQSFMRAPQEKYFKQKENNNSGSALLRKFDRVSVKLMLYLKKIFYKLSIGNNFDLNFFTA